MKFNILIGFAFSITIGYGQSINEFNNLINETIEKQFAKECCEQIVFLKDNIPSDFQLSKTAISDYKVVFFDKDQYSKFMLKQGIKAYRLLPLILKKDILSITIANILVLRKGKHTTITSSDYFIYQYRYSCEKNKWELIDVKETGI